MQKLKVYFPTFKDLGRAMHNIALQIFKYKPDWVEETKDYNQCDLVIEHIIGDHFSSPFYQDKALSQRIKNKPFVLFLYCFGCPVGHAKNSAFFKWIFDNAKMIHTYLPLDIHGFGGYDNIHYSPIGYNHESYYYSPTIKQKKSIMATGYVSSYEAIEEVYSAAQKSNNVMHHVGHNFRWDKKTYKHYEKIPDKTMRDLYLQSKYISGLRRGEGFEIPVLEGAACGARPLVFDNPHYYWFEKFAIFIEESDFDSVRQQIYDIIIRDEDVTVEEETRNYIRETFAWDVVAPLFWQALENRL